MCSVDFLEPETMGAPGLMTFVVIPNVVTLLTIISVVIVNGLFSTPLLFVTVVVVVSDVAVAGLGLPTKATIVSMMDPVRLHDLRTMYQTGRAIAEVARPMIARV
jgi:hypothetical protein